MLRLVIVIGMDMFRGSEPKVAEQVRLTVSFRVYRALSVFRERLGKASAAVTWKVVVEERAYWVRFAEIV